MSRELKKKKVYNLQSIFKFYYTSECSMLFLCGTHEMFEFDAVNKCLYSAYLKQNSSSNLKSQKEEQIFTLRSSNQVFFFFFTSLISK